MRIGLVGIVGLALVAGCGGGDGWPEAVRITFRDSCLKNGRAAAAATTPDAAVVAYCDCILEGLQAKMTHQELGEKETAAVEKAKQGGTVGEAFSADPEIMEVTQRCGAAHTE